MASAKKTTGNLVWLIFACMCVLVAPKFFFSQTESVQIQLHTTNTHACEKAEFFGSSSEKNGLPNYTVFALGNYVKNSEKPTQLTATGTLQKPFTTLRIDPCTRSGEFVELTGLTIVSSMTQTHFSAPELTFDCTNCELQVTPQKTLWITTHGSDPQLVVTNIDSKLFDHSSQLMQWYQNIRVVVFFILLTCFIWLLSRVFSAHKTLFLAIGLSNAAAAAVFFVLYKKRFSLGFNLPFGDDVFQSGVTFIHLNMYSRYTDYVLYLLPLLASLVIFVGCFVVGRRR